MSRSKEIRTEMSGVEPREERNFAEYDRGWRSGLECIKKGRTKKECLKIHGSSLNEGIEAAYE